MDRGVEVAFGSRRRGFHLSFVKRSPQRLVVSGNGRAEAARDVGEILVAWWIRSALHFPVMHSHIAENFWAWRCSASQLHRIQ